MAQKNDPGIGEILTDMWNRIDTLESSKSTSRPSKAKKVLSVRVNHQSRYRKLRRAKSAERQVQ